jgi:hypothetical protein
MDLYDINQEQYLVYCKEKLDVCLQKQEYFTNLIFKVLAGYFALVYVLFSSERFSEFLGGHEISIVLSTFLTIAIMALVIIFLPNLKFLETLQDEVAEELHVQRTLKLLSLKKISSESERQTFVSTYKKIWYNFDFSHIVKIVYVLVSLLLLFCFWLYYLNWNALFLNLGNLLFFIPLFQIVILVWAICTHGTVSEDIKNYQNIT